MKNLYLLALLISSYNFAQYNSGSATYTITIDQTRSLQNTETNLPIELKETLKRIDNSAISLKPKLNFNSSQSKFYLSDTELTKDQILASKVVCDCYEPTYYNLLEKNTAKFNSEFKLLNIKEKEYLIVDTLKTKWELESEHKIINNFKCYKATLIEEMNNGKTKSIIAWYCPEIPISAGPKGYGGLPGLIFELQDKNIVFGIKDIIFESSATIDFPIIDNYKKINSSEFNQLIAKRSKQSQLFMDSLEDKK